MDGQHIHKSFAYDIIMPYGHFMFSLPWLIVAG